MWKRERATTSRALSRSMVTLETTWLVPQSGRCDQASGCWTRFMRTSMRLRSSAKMAGTPSQVVWPGSAGIQ